MSNNRKIVLVTMFVLLSVASVWGRQRAENEMMGIAKSALLSHATSDNKVLLLGQVLNLKVTPSSDLLQRATLNSTHEAFYICSPKANNTKGFVLVSADDRMPDVLGIGDGTFSTDEMPNKYEGIS